MIARKTRKFSLNTNETTKLKIPREDSSSFFNQHKNKTASEAATSILEELGIKKSLENKKLAPKLDNPDRKTEQKIYSKKEYRDQKNHLPSDSSRKKIDRGKNDSRLKDYAKKTSSENTEVENSTDTINVKFGFHENFVFFVIFCIFTVAGIAFVGGYLRIFDSSIFQYLTTQNLHQLKFESDFKVRNIENGYNQLPLLVVEGNIKNSFENTLDVKKIQLKAFAFDSGNRIITSHFTYAGNVLTEKQLKEFSPLDIKAIRNSEGVGITEPTSLKGEIVDNRLKKQGIPFQLVFLKSVQKIKRTSVQIVSYMRNEKTIFLRSPDID